MSVSVIGTEAIRARVDEITRGDGERGMRVSAIQQEPKEAEGGDLCRLLEKMGLGQARCICARMDDDTVMLRNYSGGNATTVTATDANIGMLWTLFQRMLQESD